ncbi:phosphonate ABC transporter ATP-binding protein [Salinispira pacifica]|uniref:Phosphonate ABC transporter ATP-binding protein n=1 Tax=Salinispira pacifica TaxID=1307761 RepID=V5WGF9_9SPIO|nr:phosphonate ABC transporter ATP-binding protein [Salinispira pacifica]AHC14922.1 Phosphonate ABC transporter ATP-binding protein [Salinispira pacifica]
MIQISNLVKVYDTGDRALQGVSLTVPRGQVVALIGPSGAGKSTLLRCINRLVTPSSGSITLDSVDLTTLNKKQLRQARTKMGMIFQEYALVEHITVLENVLSGRLGSMRMIPSLLRRYPGGLVEQALKLLREVGLEDQFEKRADALSGGQRQRVGIARALMQEPRLLLVDEPTASLDPKTARIIMRLIINACRERNLPAIINLHDVQLARHFSDRILGLEKGRLVFDGEPGELNDEILTRIYGEEDWHTTLTGAGNSSHGLDSPENPVEHVPLRIEERIDV